MKKLTLLFATAGLVAGLAFMPTESATAGFYRCGYHHCWWVPGFRGYRYRWYGYRWTYPRYRYRYNWYRPYYRYHWHRPYRWHYRYRYRW